VISDAHIKQQKKTWTQPIKVLASMLRLPVLLCTLMFFGMTYFCVPAWAEPSPTAIPFEKVVVADKLNDGYWVEAVDINKDHKPDLVTSGLTEGKVVWYENPTWNEHYITTLPKPVALDHSDIDGDGWTDIVISHDYGQCMFNCGPNDGKISWLRNPGNKKLEWQKYHIGDLVATHRLHLGHLTTKDNLELLALPVVGSSGVDSPVPITLYTKPQDVLNANKWDSKVVDRSFHVIHGVLPYKSVGELDSLLLASSEGINIFSLDKTGKAIIQPIAKGEVVPHCSGENTESHCFQGSGDVSIGYLKEKSLFDHYFATVEPFHGNVIAFYTLDAKNESEEKYERTVQEIFGPQDEAVGHHVVTADFDGDGDDEFLVAERGPKPWQGVAYYDPIRNGDSKIEFKKTQLSDSSTARIAVADFDGDGYKDFATTGYYTEGYFLADDPQVLVFFNRIGSTPISHK
jgi:hypothetical protein